MASGQRRLPIGTGVELPPLLADDFTIANPALVRTGYLGLQRVPQLVQYLRVGRAQTRLSIRVLEALASLRTKDMVSATFICG